MKIKVGQYCRFKDGKLMLVIAIKKKTGLMLYDVLFYKYLENGWDSSNSMDNCFMEDIIKVVNTPQELAEVGDIVEYKNTGSDVCDGITIFFAHSNLVKYITKILTPNSNDGFDLQWEAQNE